MTPQDFVDILRKHERFTRGLTGGVRATLRNEDLSGLRLPELNLRQSVLTGVDFGGCDLTGADLSDADLFGAVFDGAKSSGARFEGSDLRGARFRDAELADANFRAADLRPGVLIDAAAENAPPLARRRTNGVRRGADLSDADLHNAAVAKSRVIERSTARVDMHGANLTRANLEAARMDEVNLTGANLQGANVRGTRLSGANLRGALLTDVDLAPAVLTGAKISLGALKLPFEIQEVMREHALWVDSFGVQGRRAMLSGTALPGADLTNIYLSGADLRRTDLSGATNSCSPISAAPISGALTSATPISPAPRWAAPIFETPTSPQPSWARSTSLVQPENRPDGPAR